MGTKFQCGMCLIDIFVKRLIYYTSRETHAVVTCKFLPKLMAFETKRNSTGPPQRHF